MYRSCNRGSGHKVSKLKIGVVLPLSPAGVISFMCTSTWSRFQAFRRTVPYSQPLRTTVVALDQGHARIGVSLDEMCTLPLDITRHFNPKLPPADDRLRHCKSSAPGEHALWMIRERCTDDVTCPTDPTCQEVQYSQYPALSCLLDRQAKFRTSTSIMSTETLIYK